jgi:hypothetical protein
MSSAGSVTGVRLADTISAVIACTGISWPPATVVPGACVDSFWPGMQPASASIVANARMRDRWVFKVEPS